MVAGQDLIVINNSCHSQERSIELPESVGKEARWIDLLDGREFRSMDRELKVKLAPRSTLVLLPEEMMKA